MVTFSFLAVFVLLGGLTFGIDIIISKRSFMESMMGAFFYQLLQDKIILYSTFIVGLIWAVVTDIRIKRKKSH